MSNLPQAASHSISQQQHTGKGNVVIDKVIISFGPKKNSIPAITETSVVIPAKQFVCLLGPSGCGKSTLLNAVAGFVRPQQGVINIDGKGITGPGPDRGMVFQQHSLLPWKTILQNIELGPNLIKDIEASRTASHFLNMVGLYKYKDHYPAQLSGGMRQRVGIARALATYPSVLLMDEPFGALDYQTRLVMQENLLKLWSELGTTLIFVTHDIDEAIFLSDRILVMSRAPGKIIADITNNLPRPRDQLVTTNKEFSLIKRRCMEIIRSESLRGMHSN